MFNLSFFDRYLEENPELVELVGGSDPKFYEIELEKSERCSKFSCDQERYRVKLKSDQQLNFTQLLEQVNGLFTELYDVFISKTRNDDQVRIAIHCNGIKHSINLPFIPASEMSPALMQNAFESVFQSFDTIQINNSNAITVDLIVAHQVKGGAPKIKPKSLNIPIAEFHSTLQLYCFKSPSVVTISGKDNSCLLKAIVLGKLVVDGTRKNIFREPNKMVNTLVNQLAFKLDIDLSQEAGIPECIRIEQELADYRITIFTSSKAIAYQGPQKAKQIYILYQDNHFNLIKSIKRFFNNSYYCDRCLVSFQENGKHNCPACCKACRRLKCAHLELICCSFCKEMCNNSVCLQIHQEMACRVARKCSECQAFKKKNQHVCGYLQKWCHNCSKAVPIDHQCFILPVDETQKQEKKFKGFIVFDYEAFVELGHHKANLIIAEKICQNCVDSDERCSEECETKTFTTNISFCRWLFDQKNCIGIAHNLKGYDGCFLLQYILENHTPDFGEPSVIPNGTKIMSITYRCVKIIDSYSFLPVGLDKLPKMFGIEELKKGYFPHEFNRPENFDYIGPYPSKETYGYRFFSEEKMKDFDKWYDSKATEQFNFQQELASYCLSDVKVLSAAVLAFRKIIMQITKRDEEDPGVDPWQTSITIASLCHHIYRRNMMVPDQIALIPEYDTHRNSSLKAMDWLNSMASSFSVHIQHALNGGEVRAGNYFIDGFSENLIFEFHGCLFHGCPRCFNGEVFNRVTQQSMSTTYLRHLNRIKSIKSQFPNHKLIEIWECDYDKLKRQTYQPLKPRDALFGGRTNAISLYYDCKENEQIKYQDYTSLYPDIQKHGVFPVGHPRIITQDFGPVENYFGLIKCTILPPTSMFFPVLPTRFNGKLVFALCAKCASEQQQTLCNHSAAERAISGTWCTLEVNEAIKHGYQIMQIFEIWHFDKTEQYDRASKQGGLFTSYVNTFLKLKTESTGVPGHISDIDEYIQSYQEHEGIELDKSNLKKNSGMRSVAKLMLNSFWGRYGMNTNKVKYRIITDAADWYKMISCDSITIHHIDIVKNELLQVFYSDKTVMHEGGKDCNVIIAAFVTCQARLKLLKEMLKLGRRVLYFDTDSIFFISRPGEYEPKLGDFLGEFTNEINPDEGEFIQEFVSAGPKNYSYRLNTGVTHCTVKGFTLNYQASQKINFETMKRIVQHQQGEKIAVDQLKFSRNKHDWSITTSVIQKQYGFVYDKRVIKEDFTTLPYGYK